MGPILTLAAKDLKSILRDKFALFWVFAFPLMYALFFGAIFGGDDDDDRAQIPIALVDEDRSEASQGLIERLRDHDALQIAREGEGESAPARLDAAEAAHEAVRLGKKVAYIRILPGYGDSPFRMFGGGKGEEENEKTLEVGIDPSRRAEAGMLEGILMQTVFEGLSSSFTDKDGLLEEIGLARAEIVGADDIGAGQKLVLDGFMTALSTFLEDVDMTVLEEGTSEFGGQDLVEVIEITRNRGNQPQSAFEITFPTAMIWGLMTVALTFAVSMVRERTVGTLLRLRIAPISHAQILAGKALGCFAMCQVVMGFLMVLGYVALGVRFDNLLLVAMSMVCTAACFTGLMMTASVFGRTEQAVAGAAWGAMMPFAMIGGGMIPLIAMPPWLLSISDFSPFKWAIYSMEGSIWRGFGVTEMLQPCGILLALGAAFFSFGVWMFRRMG